MQGRALTALCGPVNIFMHLAAYRQQIIAYEGMHNIKLHTYAARLIFAACSYYLHAYAYMQHMIHMLVHIAA